MAWVDADYKFVFVDIGAYGSAADPSIFLNFAMGKNFKMRCYPFLQTDPYLMISLANLCHLLWLAMRLLGYPEEFCIRMQGRN